MLRWGGGRGGLAWLPSHSTAGASLLYSSFSLAWAKSFRFSPWGNKAAAREKEWEKGSLSLLRDSWIFFLWRKRQRETRQRSCLAPSHQHSGLCLIVVGGSRHRVSPLPPAVEQLITAYRAAQPPPPPLYSVSAAGIYYGGGGRGRLILLGSRVDGLITQHIFGVQIRPLKGTISRDKFGFCSRHK